MVDSIEGHTIFINNNIKCTYYPLTMSTVLTDLGTGEYIVLNLDEWCKVYEFLMALTTR